MQCPKCHKTISDHETVCPFCKAVFAEEAENGAGKGQDVTSQDTGRFSAIDPDKDSYDFDLQYTLTFKDAGEIRQAIADMDLGLGKERTGDIFPAEKTENEEEKKHPELHMRSREEMEEAAQRAELRRQRRSQCKHVGRIGARRGTAQKLSRSAKEKAAALRAAKPRQNRTERDGKKNRRFVIGVGVAVLVVALIIGTINLFAGMMNGDVL